MQLRFQKTSGWGRKYSLLWMEGHMANKILIPLHSLIYCFLNPLQTGRWQWVQLGESGRGYSPVWPGGCTIHGALVAVAQAAGGSSGLNLLCAKDQANENCEHRSGI